MLRLSVKFAIDTLEKETLHTFLDVRCTGTQQSPLFSSRVCLPPRARDEKLSDFNHPLRSSKFRAKSASIDYEYSARCRTGVERAEYSRRKSAAIEPRLEISLACAALPFTYAGQPQYHDVTTGPSIACTHSSKRRLERSSGGDGQ